ncbi:hypothetical protein ACOTCJ_11665 [Achromobacter xylosoxidans]|uniref:hypothetical protein n=1 Tax=Alcaligenes xylosoxydans xylosoxydans TaxID=85698 RepID=UPI000970C477|nr:hypothetical protein [Achromobacter xylosoxidans]OMG81424.1 hypothetical protein BIZ53_29550 [Achromobacter xylosoxidans]
MKHAAEVMGLLQSQPPRAHRMAQLVQAAAAGRDLSRRERNAARQAILRLLETLREGGYVRVIQHARNSVEYRWADVDPQIAMPARDVERAA